MASTKVKSKVKSKIKVNPKKNIGSSTLTNTALGTLGIALTGAGILGYKNIKKQNSSIYNLKRDNNESLQTSNNAVINIINKFKTDLDKKINEIDIKNKKLENDIIKINHYIYYIKRYRTLENYHDSINYEKY